jgi:hypothetical protein
MFEGTVVNLITSVTLVNNTEKIIDISVPTGERWQILSLRFLNPDDVQRACSFKVFKEAAKTNFVVWLLAPALTAGAAGQWPSNTSSTTTMTIPPAILAEGNIIEAKWAAGGASAGGTDADGLVVNYIKRAARGAE